MVAYLIIGLLFLYLIYSFLLGPLIYYNGSRHILVGVSSFVVGSCGTIGVTDGFARVTNQIDWIRENSDNYVRTCSARIRSGIKSVVIEMKVGMIKMANRKDMKKISLPRYLVHMQNSVLYEMNIFEIPT